MNDLMKEIDGIIRDRYVIPDDTRGRLVDDIHFLITMKMLDAKDECLDKVQKQIGLK